MSARLLGCMLLVLPLSVRAGEPSPPAVSERFEKKVRPLLANRCWSCHGAEKIKAGLRLDSAEGLARGGDSGAVVVRGKPDESPLIAAIRYQGDLKMPPKGKLSDAEVADLVEWVRTGADWPGPGNSDSRPKTSPPGSPPPTPGNDAFWAFQPTRDPIPPNVTNNPWPKSPIDRFILSSLERRSLKPAPAAEKRALIRRATFDLVGLPPSTEEINTFLNDESPLAFAKVVDRLLASPSYGQRWGRHWLDLARYADSNGMDENVAYSNAFRYRDYVIRSLNSDKPYDQFIKEQIAGDLLPRSDEESINQERLVATGFLVLGPKMLAEDDPVKMEMDIIDEQVDTVGRVFMGLTLGCARCHDHKFDPIPTADYYGLAGIFKSTKTMQNHSVVAMWNERPLATRGELIAFEAHKKEVADRKAEIGTRVEQARATVKNENLSRLSDYLVAAWEWNRSREHRKKLVDGKIGDRSPGTIYREAESFDKGNVLIDTTNYGRGIGVVLNRGELPNFAEYVIDLPREGVYQIEVRHTAADARPVRLLIDGSVVVAEVAGAVTGSWGPEKQAWSAVGLHAFKSGRSMLRLERDGPFPHIDKFALVPRTLPEGVELSALKTLPDLGRERRLNPRLIERWTDVLAKARGDEGSIFHRLSDDKARPEPRASHAHAAFDRAAKADIVSRINDPILAAYRDVLDDVNGPFGLPEAPESLFPDGKVEELRRLREGLAELEKKGPVVAEAMSVEERKATDLRVHLRGNHLTLGEDVPRHFPRALGDVKAEAIDASRSGRLELANWLVRPEHPLTARVMVNRIWLGHFGEGIVRSPDNFGHLGERPDHPELLDWLATRFVESGWSVKAMHRQIMLSSTYRMSTRYDSDAALADPENRLLWHMKRRRLDVESMRDAILAVSGELDATMGGTVMTAKNHSYVYSTGGGIGLTYDVNRRSVYLPVIRSALYDVFQAFDFADPSASNGQRVPTTVAPQALFMLNDKLVLRCSDAMARRLLARADLDTSGRIREAYGQAFGRPALDREVLRATEYLGRFESELEAQRISPDARPQRAWQALCQSILASSAFLYLD